MDLDSFSCILVEKPDDLSPVRMTGATVARSVIRVDGPTRRFPRDSNRWLILILANLVIAWQNSRIERAEFSYLSLLN